MPRLHPLHTRRPPPLILIHNHRFDENIDKLNHIYRNRFTNIFHLVPFYTGSAPNVIGVGESSHHFQGFFAQALPSLARDEFEHCIFCADDLILHPSLTQNNLPAKLGLDTRSAYIKSIKSFADASFAWPHAVPALVAFSHNSGVDWEKELPSREEAVAVFQAHGLDVGYLNFRHFRRGIRPKQLVLLIFYLLKRLQRKAKIQTTRVRDFPYPLAYGYSDLFVLPRYALGRFCHLCSIFAAMNLFVEVAIPISLLMSCDRVVHEHMTGKQGLELWQPEDIDRIGQENGFSLRKLLENFPPNRLYVHPVKLSRWQLG